MLFLDKSIRQSIGPLEAQHKSRTVARTTKSGRQNSNAGTTTLAGKSISIACPMYYQRGFFQQTHTCTLCFRNWIKQHFISVYHCVQIRFVCIISNLFKLWNVVVISRCLFFVHRQICCIILVLGFEHAIIIVTWCFECYGFYENIKLPTIILVHDSRGRLVHS